MTIRRSVLLPFFVAFGLVLALLLTVQSAAGADATGIAQADSGGLVDEAGDVFSAGRRAGFLFVAVGLGVAWLSQMITTRLKPKDGKRPKPGSWRARLSVTLGALSMIAIAVVDLFAESRGLTGVTTAVIGALALARYSKDDPERGSRRGSRREPEASGEIEAP